MKTLSGRFRPTDQGDRTRHSLRVDILALRRELELLAEALRTDSTPISARAALDRAFFCLRAAERMWRGSRHPAALPKVVSELDDARRALQESLDALARRRVEASSTPRCVASA